MAELLIKAVDATHADADKDRRGCYKRGDIVLIKPDGHEWGRKELLAPADGGKFVVVKIPGVSPSQVRNAIRRLWSIDPDASGEDRRRRIRIDVHLLPANVRQTLNTTGQFTTTWNAVRQFVRNKLTDQTAANEPIGA